jgi:hypothetical protein
MKNLKGFGRKRQWHNRPTIPVFFWRGYGKPPKSSVRIFGVFVGIRTEEVSKRNLGLRVITEPFGATGEEMYGAGN